MNRSLIIFSYFLILIGFIGFLVEGLISTGIINYDNEVPLGNVKGIVVDSTGDIFLGLGNYGKVQCYDKSGNFLRNWSVDAFGGTFMMRLDRNQNIIISTAKGNEKIVYSRTGEVVSKKTIKEYSEVGYISRIYETKESVKYEVIGSLFPVVSIDQGGYQTMIIKQDIILRFLSPEIAWIIAACGMIMNFILRRDKLATILTKNTTQNNAIF